MPRKPRMYLAGVPCHVIQRGNNRVDCFFAEDDYVFYLECLKSASARYKVAIHAYVLMTNHVHILATPADQYGISRVMQSIGRRYVQYVNRRYKRTGTLWEGRHRSSLIQAVHYLFACQRYIELNPVRAGMVDHPGDYRWNSYRCNAHGMPDHLVSPHDLYKQLGLTSSDRLRAYREIFSTELPADQIHDVRNAARFCMPLGDQHFHKDVEAALNRPIGYAQRGRPRRDRND